MPLKSRRIRLDDWKSYRYDSSIIYGWDRVTAFPPFESIVELLEAVNQLTVHLKDGVSMAFAAYLWRVLATLAAEIEGRYEAETDAREEPNVPES